MQGWLLLLPVALSAVSACDCTLTDLKVPHVLQVAWLPQLPYVYWGSENKCDAPTGVLVRILDTFAGEYNAKCNSTLVVRYDCTTTANASEGAAYRSLANASADILTKFSLADPHRNFFSVVKAPKPVLTYYGGAADPSSINVSDLNDLIFNETWPVILWSAILILTLVFLIWFLENHLQKLPGGISFTSGIYFAITTFTTVGYGDLVPKTRLSKILTATFMLISLILVAVLTSSFTSISNRELLQSAVYANKHITVGVVNGSVPSITSLASYLFPTYQYFRFSDLVVSALNRQEAVSVLLDGYTTQAYSSGYVSMYDFATTSPNFESDAKYSIASQSSGTFYSGFIANLEDSTRVAFECWLSKAKTSMYEHLTKLDQDYQAFQEERYRSSSSTLGSEYDSAVTSYLKQNLKWLVATCAGLIFVFVLGGQTALWISGKPLPVDDERNASIAGSSDFDAAFGSLSLSARALEEPLLQGCSNRRRTGSVMLEDVERRSSEPLHE